MATRPKKKTKKQQESSKKIIHFLIVGSIFYILCLSIGWYFSEDVREGIIIFMNNNFGSFSAR